MHKSPKMHFLSTVYEFLFLRRSCVSDVLHWTTWCVKTSITPSSVLTLPRCLTWGWTIPQGPQPSLGGQIIAWLSVRMSSLHGRRGCWMKTNPKSRRTVVCFAKEVLFAQYIVPSCLLILWVYQWFKLRESGHVVIKLIRICETLRSNAFLSVILFIEEINWEMYS